MTIQGDAGAVRPYATGGTFLNFLKDSRRVPDAFDPADYERLRQIKRAYDPENLFRAGHAIALGDADVVGVRGGLDLPHHASA